MQVFICGFLLHRWKILKKQLANTDVSFVDSSVFSFSERLKMTCYSQYPGLAQMEESADWSSKFSRLSRANN